MQLLVLKKLCDHSRRSTTNTFEKLIHDKKDILIFTDNLDYHLIILRNVIAYLKESFHTGVLALREIRRFHNQKKKKIF